MAATGLTRLWAALAASLALPAFAASMALDNPGFESWSEQGLPTHWASGAGTYRLRRDCDVPREGHCSLELEDLAGARREAASVSQRLAPGPAAGHRLRISGYIRTRDLADGFAGLWARVEGRRGSVFALENMVDGGAKGTAGWRRFEIAISVAPNAARVFVGINMTGTGAAWFDGLSLDVDESVEVPPYPETPPPPRPVPSQALQDDASLGIGGGKPSGAAWAHPIRSLFSDDFSDLEFLAPILQGKRVVQLGESGHGVAEFSWMKVRLVKYLHERLGFDVIAFEGSLSGCDVADSRIGSEAPREVMRDCLFGVSFTSEVLPLFEYLEAQRKAGHPLYLAGFDNQNSGAAKAAVSERLVRLATLVDPALAATILEDEGNLRWPIPPKDAVRMAESYEDLAARLSKRRDELLDRGTDRALLDITLQEARSRARLVRQLSRKPEEGYPIRDECMADNLDFLLDRKFAGHKVVTWAHNLHLAKDPRPYAQWRTMGTIVASRRGREVYTIGLYMGRGVAAENDRTPYDIGPPPPRSLEAILAGAGWKMSVTDLSRELVPSWAEAVVLSRDWGKYPAKIVPARAYDGLIYIDTVTPPEYLE